MPEHLPMGQKVTLNQVGLKDLGSVHTPIPYSHSHKFFEGQWGKGFKVQNIVSFWYKKSDRNIQ